MTATDDRPTPEPHATDVSAALERAATTPVPEDDRGIAGDVRAVVENAISAVGRAGTISAAGLADAVEGAGRSLSRRAVDKAIDDVPAVGDRKRLANALADRPATPFIASGTAAAVSSRILRRVGPLRFLTRRTPAFLLASAVPALVASVSRGADELGLVAAHLHERAIESGVDPDRDRVRRVAVQLVEGVEVDPDIEPGYGPLAVAWLRRAARSVMPFTSGIATKDPEGLATAASKVDPRRLAVAAKEV